VIANNSGGMRCTVKNDAYQTVSAMTFVMPSGVLIDTSASDAEAAFERTEPDLAIGLLELRGQLLADRELVDRVRRKYAIRNTHGYRLCALLDGETPLEIFRRLLVASKGSRPLSLPRAKRSRRPLPIDDAVAHACTTDVIERSRRLRGPADDPRGSRHSAGSDLIKRR